MKVVINKCFGGFGLSREAVARYAEIKGIKLWHWYDEITRKVYGPERVHEGLRHYSTVPVETDEHGFLVGEHPATGYWSDSDLERNDPVLVQVVEALGSEAASGEHARLAIVEIPDGTDYEIGEYDGQEHIAEKHRTWG